MCKRSELLTLSEVSGINEGSEWERMTSIMIIMI